MNPPDRTILHPLTLDAFEERAFYLAEFRGRTLVFAALPGALSEPRELRGVLDLLAENETRSVVLLADALPGDALGEGTWVDPAASSIAARCWRAARTPGRRALVSLVGRPFFRELERFVLALAVSKVVLLDTAGGARLEGGAGPSSFIDLATLERQRAEGRMTRTELLGEVERLLAHVEAVNLTTPAGVEAELLTYAGSGTLFTRGRYVAVRRLGIEDLDAAHGLVQRGVAEGFLQPRGPDALDRILAQGYGAFIEGRFLGGICALERYADDGVGELVSVYTLTRFQGEGLGRHLIDAVADEARRLGLRALFACTTSDRAGRYFARAGFEPVALERLPERKWDGYDAARRERLTAFWLPLSPEATPHA